MTTTVGLCRQQIVLAEHEAAALRGLAGRTAGSDRVLDCGLVADHGHEHAANVGEDEWWLRWWPGRRVLERLPSCGEIDETGVPSSGCRCPVGHEGKHAFATSTSAG